jgi:septal ring factor EnvC (AmiA/AmiB activator)
MLIGSAGASVAQTKEEQAQALAETKRRGVLAQRRSEQLEAKAAQASDDAATARAQAVELASQVQEAEAGIAAAKARIAAIEVLRARQRARLAAMQEPIARLTGALQTMARRPPALAIVQPGSLSDLIHVRSLLATAVPVIRARTAALRAEVEEGNRLRRRADLALAAVQEGQKRLVERRIELARLEMDYRRRSRDLSAAAMVEQDRVLAMSEKSRDISELMDDLDEQAEVRARLAELPGPLLRPLQPGAARALVREAAVRRTGRPPYRLPVVGRLVSGLGEVSEAGLRAKGLTLATASSAQVVAPAKGRIGFAGPFRGYGNIVIVDHGGGWASLITHLAHVSVRVGDRVDQGSPIGRMGTGNPRVTVELRRSGRAIDIVPLVAAG